MEAYEYKYRSNINNSINFTVFFIFLGPLRHALLYTVIILLLHVELIVAVTMHRGLLPFFLLVLLSYFAGYFCVFVNDSRGRLLRRVALN